jgi:hypothetical protein
MMSIVEQFGGKRKDPTMPKTPLPPAPHEQHAKALMFLQDISAQADYLRGENEELRSELHLARHRIRDLEEAARETRSDLEAYRRYSVEVKTHLQHIVDAATRANEAALDAGEQRPPDKLEKIEDILAEEIGKKYGNPEPPTVA